MPTYSADILPSQTGLKLGSQSQQWDIYTQNLTISGTFLATGTIGFKNLEGIRFADQFSGATVTNKLDAALADAATLLVVAPSTLGAGNPSAINAGKCLLDLRAGVPKFFTNASPSVPALTLADDGTLSGTFKTTSSNTSSTGVIRLANADVIKARNAANLADLAVLKMNASNILEVGDVGGVKLAGPLTGLTSLALNGALSGVTTAAFSGQITSTLATGTAPFSIASTTVVPNLNVNTLNGVSISNAPTGANQFLRSTSSSAANWASLGQNFLILNKQDQGAGLVGNSADQTVYTYSMPSGTLAVGQGVRITFYFLRTAGSDTPTFKLFFGGTTLISTALTAASLGKQWAIVMNNTGSTAAQWATGETWNQVTPTFSFNSTSPAENTVSGSAIVIKATFNCPNTSTVTGKGWLVELVS